MTYKVKYQTFFSKDHSVLCIIIYNILLHYNYNTLYEQLVMHEYNNFNNL